MKKILFSVAIAAAALIGVSSCSNGAPKANLQNDLDSLGYAYGVHFGSQFSNFQDSGMVVPDEVMDINNFLAGFNTAMRRDSANSKMTLEEAHAFINEMQAKINQKMQEKRTKEIAENKQKGADFMAANATKEGVVTLESGLQIETITEGTGKQPKDGDKVKVNYKGTLVDGTVFDQNEGIEFPTNGVVKGFKEGLLNMKEGGKAIITMPSELAYGDNGAGQNIPGGATLQFEVELVEVIANK